MSVLSWFWQSFRLHLAWLAFDHSRGKQSHATTSDWRQAAYLVLTSLITTWQKAVFLVAWISPLSSDPIAFEHHSPKKCHSTGCVCRVCIDSRTYHTSLPWTIMRAPVNISLEQLVIEQLRLSFLYPVLLLIVTRIVHSQPLLQLYHAISML